MAMEQLKENVMKEVQWELNRANEKFPLFNGPHEGYAVILEELEETEEALEDARRSIDILWDKIRGKNTVSFVKKRKRPIRNSQDFAEHLAEEFALVACEAIQTAAMCLKYGLSVDPEEPEARTGGAADE